MHVLIDSHPLFGRDHIRVNTPIDYIGLLRTA